MDPLHLARRLEDDSASPDGWRTTHPTPKGYTPPRPTPEGWARPRPTPEGRLHLIQRPMMNLASPDIRRLAPSHLTNHALHPYDDGYRVRQDVRVNHSVRRHALHPCKEVPSGCDRTSAGTSPQAWQSLNSVAGACSPPYSIIGAALSLRTKDPTWTYDNHDVPRANQQSPRRPTPTGSGLDNPIRPAARGGGMGCPTC